MKTHREILAKAVADLDELFAEIHGDYSSALRPLIAYMRSVAAYDGSDPHQMPEPFIDAALGSAIRMYQFLTGADWDTADNMVVDRFFDNITDCASITTEQLEKGSSPVANAALN